MGGGEQARQGNGGSELERSSLEATLQLRGRRRIAGRRPTFALAVPSGPAARARADFLERITGELRGIVDVTLLINLIEQAAIATDDELAAVATVVRGLRTGDLAASPQPSKDMTFDELFTAWHSNDLHVRFPDHVRKLKVSTADDYLSLYRTYVKATLGKLPISAISVDHAFQVMERVPSEGASNSLRRNAGIVISRPLRLAVFPLRILERSPIPDGFLPKKKAGRAKVYLYPSEDARLLACTQIPLVLCLVYGLLTREGPRVTEACGLAVSECDLVNGVLYLDRNKTDEPRSWAMAEGTTEALRRFVARFHPNPEQDSLLFLATEHDVDPE